MMKSSLFSLSLAVVAVLLVTKASPAHGQAIPMCASPEQVAVVRSALVGKEPAPLGAIAATLQWPEALIASAVQPAHAYGVSAIHFRAIWKSIESWDDATTFITKGPDLFEIQGRVGKGEPSKRSKFFNLLREGSGLAGHLRPDLYSSIYILEIPGESTTLRGVVFFDQTGQAVFSVYVPGEGKPPTPAGIQQFEATVKIVRALPPACP